MGSRLPDIFLSYSREDQVTARRFAEGFEREGFSVWWDQALNAGEVYDKVTEQALEKAGAVVVLWSKLSVESRWVRSEATTADRLGTLIPVMIEACKRPIQFELMQTAELAHWKGDARDGAWQGLVTSVRRYSDGSVPRKSPPVVQIAAPRRGLAMYLAIAMAVLAVGGVWFWTIHRASPSPAAVATAAPEAGASIAVLPFANMSSDPEQEYFSDGLTEELLNQLSQVPQLRVIGRTSSFAFKGKSEDLRKIGQILGVNHILEGSVRKAGHRIKITAQLVNPADGSNLWSETYERQLDDVFAIQDEISRTVAKQLQLKLGVPELNADGTRNVAAYDEYLAGRSLLASNETASLSAAAPRFERTLALDPDFMGARLWLIDAYLRLSLGAQTTREDYLRRQDANIDEVVHRAPGTPEASFAMSYRAARGHDLVQLESLLKDAARIPGSAGLRSRMRYGQFLMGVGNARAALQQMELVWRDDPLDDFVRTQVLLARESTGDIDRAEREVREFLLTPGGKAPAIYGAALTIAEDQRDPAKVRQAAQAYIESGLPDDQGKEALRRLLDDPAAAKAMLEQEAHAAQLQGNVYFFSNIALEAAYLEDDALALEGLAALFRQGFSFETTVFVLWRPVMRNVWSQPQFKSIVRDLGLVDYWRTTGNWGDHCKPVGKDDFECH